MNNLEPDRVQIEQFVDAVFRNVSDAKGYISLRSFVDTNKDEVFRIMPVRLNGEGLQFLVEVAVDDARRAAQAPKPVVFSPPIAVFNGKKARKKDVVLGPALCVECDTHPYAAHQKLGNILGPLTVSVRSGGVWIDPETGEAQDKLHLHWRLAKPAENGSLPSLEEARRLACAIVDGDPSNVPISHPIRWPGSWHRKAEPRLCEIELDWALMKLAAAAPAAGQKPNRKAHDGGGGERSSEPRADIDRVRKALKAIPNDNVHWNEWVKIGLAAWAATSGSADGFAAWDAWSQKAAKHEAANTAQKWAGFHRSPPDSVGAGTLFMMAEEAKPGWEFGLFNGHGQGGQGGHAHEKSEQPGPDHSKGGTEREADANQYSQGQSGAGQGSAPAQIFDPWDEYIVPLFPLDVLPDSVQRFVETQSRVIGCDPASVAMAALANFSAAIDHRTKLKMLRNGSWYVSPRLWVLLYGDPSRKKTPPVKVATAGLQEWQDELWDAWERERDGVKEADPKADDPPRPPRFIVGDTTVEKLGEILARSDRGLLVKRDEFAGWIGSMERYGGSGSSDRSFWIDAYDGGPQTIDRIKRGESRIPNLSVSLIGGIQPEKLKDLHGLTSDGLLQRFIPVMVGKATFPVDEPTDMPFDAYRKLTRTLLGGRYATVIMTDAGLEVAASARRRLHEIEQVTGGLTPGFQSFIGKLPGVLGSLALILHMIGEPLYGGTLPVEEKAILNAARLIEEFVLPHAFEFYRTAESATDGDRLQKVASWILTSGKARFVVSDLTTNVAAFRGLSLWDVNQRVSPLVAGGWLTPEERGPVSRSWSVSPDVFGQLKARTEEEERRKAALAKLMNSRRRGKTV